MPTETTDSLRQAGIRFVRVLWCDNANVIRGKAIHIQMLDEYRAHGLGLTPAQQGVPVMADSVVTASGLGPVGDVRLMPDWDTLTPLPYAPGHARVMGDMTRDGRPWPPCPRSCLKRLIDEAKQDGLRIQAAFENEFYLLRPATGAVAPADDTVFAATLAMDNALPVINDVVDSLLTQGIPVELYYPESGPGQHEISMRYADALLTADRQIVFRETVHATAARHGLKASFLPKIWTDQAGSGCHLHLSLWRQGRNITADPQGAYQLSDTARGFIGGILRHLPALMAVTTPSSNSYRRIRPHCWSGAYRCWGLDNREAAIRVPFNPAGPGPSNIELKTCDASANPYLALAAVLAVGLDGIRRQLDPGEPVQVDPGNWTADERKARHIDELPITLGEAIGHCQENEVLRRAFGPDLFQAFLAVRQAEWNFFRERQLADEVQVLLERY
ncbi:MAG: glutamine synthetase family protein [Gemmataceae bacterium]